MKRPAATNPDPRERRTPPEWPSQTAKKLGAHLRGLVGKAIEDYRMIADGDRVMVCLSGGKDSYTLLDVLLSLKRSPRPSTSSSSPSTSTRSSRTFPKRCCPTTCAALGVPFHVIEQDTYSVVKRVIPEGKTMCGLCSRMRRGALYRYAAENGITKIALGHHRDDIVETLFLNLFLGGRLKAMAPKLKSDDGRHIVIRPLAYVAESLIERYARARQFPDHSLQAVRVAGQRAAQGGQAHAGRMGAAISRAHRVDLLRAAQRRSRPTWPIRGLSIFRGWMPNAPKSLNKPIGESYWVIEDRLLAGRYPGGKTPKEAERRVPSLLAAGFDAFIDLTEAGRAPALRPLSTRQRAVCAQADPRSWRADARPTHGRDPGGARRGAGPRPARVRALPRRDRPHRHGDRLPSHRTGARTRRRADPAQRAVAGQ